VRVIRVLLAAGLLLPATASADQIVLPTSDAAQLAATALLKQLPGFRPDRLLPSKVPGPVINDEIVRVGVAGNGTVRQVLLDQRLRLEGVGDYAIRERGPARSAVSLTSDPAPVTRLGAVVWQGFSPGSRDLGARLVLDPLIEAVHLPLSVQVSFVGADGRTRPLDAGGRVPGPGSVTVTIRNDSAQPADLPTAADVSPSAVANALDRALAVARAPSAERLPTTDNGLPAKVTVKGAAQVGGTQAVPFRLVGTLRLTGTRGTVTGPATTALADGARFAGVLSGAQSVTFTATTSGPGALVLHLTATSALDARALVPPRGLATWRAWASSHPPLAERRAALDLLVEVAATGARASSYSPYLGAGLRGSGSTRFEYAFAAAERSRAVVAVLHPKWGPISLAALAFVLLLGVAEGLRRQL
jgi:hypothetical protein